MPTVEIIPARPCHVRTIARRMRQQDRDEVYAAARLSPRMALKLSLAKSSVAMTAVIDGRPEIMWGAADINILTGVAAPWLLGTDAVTDHPRIFAKHSVEWRAKLLGRYTVLRNFVDERNTVSVRWLKWLGFRFLDRVDLNGVPFRLFEMRADDVRTHDDAGAGCDHRVNGARRGWPDAAGAGNC